MIRIFTRPQWEQEKGTCDFMRIRIEWTVGVCLAIALGLGSDRSLGFASAQDSATSNDAIGDRSPRDLASQVAKSKQEPESKRETRTGETRPNVIVIVTDDQGWADIGYNNSRVYTPNMDRLARGGVVFTQHYVMPQCTPTRVALMTGRYPGRFGGAALQASNAPAFPLGTPTLGTMFRRAGYETWLIGKWHLGSRLDHGPMQFGFDHSYGSLAGAVGMYNHRYRPGEFQETWQRDGKLIEGADNGVHATDLVADEAVRVVCEPHERPFFIYLAFHAPHTPLDERGEFVDQPTARDPENPERWRHENEIPWFNDPSGIIQQETDPEKRLFLAAVHHVDDAVGRVVTALDQTGQLNNTLIMFTSDNGPQVNWPGNAYPDDLKLTDFNQPHPWRGHKTDVYEGGIRVPGFWYWRGKLSPGEFAQPVHVVDWMPTLAHVVGLDRPADHGAEGALDGIDLWPHVGGRAAMPARSLYWTWGTGPNRWALRSGDFKVVKYGRPEPTLESWQLFDLANDPAEGEDLRSDARERTEMADALRRLHGEFLDHRSRDHHRP